MSNKNVIGSVVQTSNQQRAKKIHQLIHVLLTFNQIEPYVSIHFRNKIQPQIGIEFVLLTPNRDQIRNSLPTPYKS